MTTDSSPTPDAEPGSPTGRPERRAATDDTSTAGRRSYGLGGADLPPAGLAAVTAALARPDAGDREVHAAITDALVGALPTLPGGEPDWRAATGYVRANLAGHAARGGVLDRLMLDPGFLLAAEPGALLAVLDAVVSAEAAAVAHAYRRAVAYLRDDWGRAAAALQLAARRTGAEQLADRIGYLGDQSGGLPWSTRWMLVGEEEPHQTVAALPGTIHQLLCGWLPDGTPVVRAAAGSGVGHVSARGQWTLPGGAPVEAGPVRWDSDADEPPPPRRGWERAVTALALTPLGTLRGGPDGVVRLWPGYADPSTPAGEAFSTPDAAGAVLAGGRGVFVVCHRNGAIGVWDRESTEVVKIGEHNATAAACVVPPGGPALAVTAGQDGRALVFDVAAGRLVHTFQTPPADPLPGTGTYYPPGREPPKDRPESLRAVTAGVTEDGRAVAVALGFRGWLHRWDVVTGEDLGRTFLGRVAETVRTVRCDGRALAVVGSWRDLMMFDLASGEPVAVHSLAAETVRSLDTVDAIVAVVDRKEQLHRYRLRDGGAALDALGGPTAVPLHNKGVSCGRLADARPVAVTGSEGGVIRVWDLTDGRMLHHIPIEDVVKLVVLADDGSIFAGLSGGLAVFRLEPG